MNIIVLFNTGHVF